MRDFDNVLRCIYGRWNYHKLDEEELRWVVDIISNLSPTNTRPDAIAYKNDDLLLIEHFEFDNSKATKKGSKQHLADVESYREKSKTINDLGVIEQEVKRNGKYFIENFSLQFNKHYPKIGEYRETVEQQLGKTFKNVKTMFVIEDSSPLTSVYLQNFKPVMLNLVHCKEFLDLFEICEKLNYVLFVSKRSLHNSITMFVSKCSLPYLRSIQIEGVNIRNFCFEKQYIL